MKVKKIANFRGELQSIDEKSLNSFSDLSEFVHSLGLDWWQTNVKREFARFGRKDDDGKRAKYDLGAVRFKESGFTISMNFRSKKIEKISQKQNADLTQSLVEKIKTELKQSKSKWPNYLKPRSSKEVYWPNDFGEISGRNSELLKFLLDESIPEGETELLKKIENNKNLSDTQKKSLIQARVGQGEFRDKVLSRAKFKCEVTGLTRKELLIASHILAWAKCKTAKQRLDANNGLLLSPNLDKLFDRGIISFDENGLIISKATDLDVRNILIPPNIKGLTEKPNKEQCEYLKLHRAAHNF